MTEAGVYLSDRGHLLILQLDPVRVSCVLCAVTCFRSQFKNKKTFDEGAIDFVAKHGALDHRIANSIEEIVGVYLNAKKLYYVFDPPFVYVPEVFDVSPETIASLDDKPKE